MSRASSLLLAVSILAGWAAYDCPAQSIAEDLQFRTEIIKNSETGDTIQTFYYPNGNKRSEGRLMNGMREGEWMLWYFNGRIWMIGNYHHDQLEGNWKFWDDGLVVETNMLEGQLRDGVADGHWTYYYPNSNIRSEGDWVQGLQTGKWTYRYPGNQMMRIENWANGQRDELWEFWHVNGQKEREEHYNAGIKHGTWTYWYDNGNMERKENWQNGYKHGLWTFWYYSGQIEMQGTFANDNASGEWTVWYENGEKQMEGNLQANTMEDVWTYWYPNSDKKANVTYRKGDIIGVRLLKARPVNRDRRPEVISSGAGRGNYLRETKIQSVQAPTTVQGAAGAGQALQGVNQPVTIPQQSGTLQPNNSQNTERVSGFQSSTGNVKLEGQKPGK